MRGLGVLLDPARVPFVVNALRSNIRGSGRVLDLGAGGGSVAATLDDNVHLQNSLQFLHALQMNGKDCELMLYPGVRHGIETLPQQLHLFGRFLRFLDENLLAL